MKLGKLAIALVFSVSACAASPKNISAQYVSPTMYSNLSCDQIRAEMMRVGARVQAVTGQQQKAANDDALAMGVGIVLFWPALFFLVNDNDKKEELSRLKGEYDALQQASNMNCVASPVAATASPAASVTTEASPATLSPRP